MARQLFVDPYAGQAIDLLQEPARSRAAALAKIADAQARSAEISGNATANAAQQSGQAWSGAANQIGQTIGAIPGQIEQARTRSLQQQNLQGQITDRAAQQKQRERENASVAAGSAAIKASIDPETGQIDHEKAADLWEKAGFPVAANTYRESLQKTRATAQQLTEGQMKIAEGQKKIQEAAVNHLGELGLVGLESLKNKTPLEARDTTLGLIANAAAHGLIKEEDAQQFLMQSAAMPPDQLAAFYQHFVDAAPAVKERALKDELTRSEIAKNTAAAVKQPAAKSLQSKSVLVDGKPSEASYNPADGSWQVGGQSVDAARVKPIPPASTVINTQRDAALANLPTWATDASRPSGPDANKMDPHVRMTPNGLFQSAQTYIATGQFPPTGRGADPASLAVRAAINAKVGAIAAESGLDEPTLRAFYKSNAASLGQQQKMYDAVQGFMATADKNADLLAKSLEKITDIGSPLFNKPLRAFEKDVAGDPNLSQFATYIKSVQNEYGRIISQPNLAGQLTDSARHEASVLIDPNATVPQIVASIGALKNEGNNRLVSVGQQIQNIQKRMSTPGASSQPPSSEQAPIVWERGPDGKPRKVGG